MNDTRPQHVVGWLADGPERGPDELLSETFATVARTRQLPAWRLRMWWLTAPVLVDRTPLARTARIAMVLVLLAAVAAAVLLAAGRLRPPSHVLVGQVAVSSGEKALLIDLGSGQVRTFGANCAVISPDGRKLVYFILNEGTSVDMSGGTDSVWIDDLDGAPPRLITSDGRSTGGVAWSPDGTRIAIVRRPSLGEQLFIHDVESGAATRVDGWTGHAAPRWSPDGVWLAWPDHRGGSFRDGRLRVVSVDGAIKRELGAGNLIGSVAWSPDSRSIAYVADLGVVSFTSTSRFLYLVDVEGGVPERLTERGTDPLQPVWSPDGRWIAYRTQGLGGTPTGWAILDPLAGTVRALPDFEGAEGSIWWSPAGDYLAAIADRDLIVLTPDGDVVARHALSFPDALEYLRCSPTWGGPAASVSP